MWSCKSCDVWKEHCDSLERQIASLSRERDILLNHIIGPKVQEPIDELQQELKPVKQFTPFRVRQQMAEAESRVQAKILLDKEREIREANEKLEKELHLEDDNVISENAG